MIFSTRNMAASLLMLCCIGCGAGGGGSEVASNADLRTENADTSDVLFAPNRLLKVDIQMPEADYDLLRREGRTLPQHLAGCGADFSYDNYTATVTVDGETLADVDIRKKGYLGSLSATRPSFKLNFDEHSPGRRFHGLKRMTLNNNRQDPGNTHQCMAYKMFRDVGLPAPRCSFAEVTMNGESLGIYSHIESMQDNFLKRNFGSKEGNLYEAQFADFGQYTSKYFQLKNNNETADRSDIEAVVSAMEASDENLSGLLGQVLDIDAYLSHWAMEGIAGHWDSATGNANNAFVYHNPENDLFYYIPWGADGAMELENLTGLGSGPLYRYTNIPSRLYSIPQFRNKYHKRVLELLDQVWDEKALLAEVDRIARLTNTEEVHLTQVRDFISQHEARVRASVSGELEQVERTIVDEATVCKDSETSTISGSFTNGVGFFEYVDINGDLITVPAVATAPSDEPQVGIPLASGISITLAGSAAGVSRIGFLSIEENEFKEGEVLFHGVATSLILIEVGGNSASPLAGFTGAGSITFDEPPSLGQPVNMHFSAELWLNDGSGFGAPGGF